MAGDNILEGRVTHQSAKRILNRVYDQFLLGDLRHEPTEWECRETVARLLSQLPTERRETTNDTFDVSSPMD